MLIESNGQDNEEKVCFLSNTYVFVVFSSILGVHMSGLMHPN